MVNDNVFSYATRNKLRFTSVRGELTVEQLWDVPLRSKDDFNLNIIAKGANEELKAANEENFVETTKTPSHMRFELTLEIVKHIIEVKLGEEEKAKKRAENKKEKEQLLAALVEKQAGKLSEMSEQQLRKRIAALETDD
jgi:hypothetical protein